MKGDVSVDELISFREHQRQVLIFETQRRSASLDIQNGASDFWIFVSLSKYGSEQFMLTELNKFFLEKVKTGRRKIAKSQAPFWKQGIDEHLYQVWTLPSYP